MKTYLPYRLKNRLYPKVIWAKRSIILSMNIRHYVIIHFKHEYEMDNNAIERINRYISLSRRNSLFCGSHQGAKRAALIYSLACSCRLNRINTFEYFKDLLNKFIMVNPNTNKKYLRGLLPDKWKK